MEDNTDFDPLYQLLQEVQLGHFYQAIKSIDVTKVEHFENVLFDDLIGTQVGMGAPAARRLLEAAKKRNNKWKKNLFQIILPGAKIKEKETISDKSLFDEKIIEKENINHETVGLTCLIPNKDIKLLDKIGDGSFGVVMRAQWTHTNKVTKYVAVKVLKQEVLSRALEDFAKEVNAMHQLKHQNLIKLYGIVLSSPMMMVTELAEQGSLRTKLVRTQGKLSLTTLVNYSFQIANGMNYLETKRLIHRDLATRNIFITGNDIIKIGDFGLMRSVPCEEDYYTMSDNMKVPFPWCALESLKYRQFSHASDTWMYGVTLWEIFSFGQEPWAGLNGSQIIRKLEQNERLSIPNSCSQQIYQVMNLCWNHEPKERPTFTALIKFFKFSQPIKLKALSDFDNYISLNSKILNSESEKTFLKLYRGDEVEVIEGKSENYWWKGQNQRTFEIGYFPRSVAKDLRTLNSNDISKPLKNSFIHTGHMDPTGKKSWGNPEFIEKMYLEHPIEPQDLLGFDSSDGISVILETRSGRKNAELINEEKIEKIFSLDELVSSKDDPDELSNAKEGILIDFDNEVNHIESYGAVINTAENDTSTNLSNNELSEIKFNTQEILDLYNKQAKIKNEEKIVEDDQSVDKFMKEDNNPTTTETTIVVNNDKNNSYSKYYMPPFDNQVNSQQVQFSKNRYYSSVCSNCDFTTGTTSRTTNNFCSTATKNETNNATCQCCFDLSYNSCTSYYIPSVSMNFSTNCFTNDRTNFFNHNNFCTASASENYFPSCQPAGDFTSFSSSSSPTATTTTTTTITTSTSTTSTSIENNIKQQKLAFQTKICKDFIDELEANFSKIGQARMKDMSNQDCSITTTIDNTKSIVYPTINPPPKSYKTRRPAPPPPVQKKN